MKPTKAIVKVLITLVITMNCAIVKTSAQTSSGATTTTNYKSAGKSIKVEWFQASKAKPKSVVIILHGSGGLQPSGGFFRQIAADIANTGRTAVVVHYFDRSGISWATSAQMGAHFGEWLLTIKDAVSYFEKQPGVDKSHITLLGHSLGAQLALHVAATDKRVNAVIDMAGCFVLPTKSITRMPPVLILHGTSDRTVSLSRERAMTAVLRSTKSKYEEHILKNVDHAFNNVSLEELEQMINKFLDSLP